MVVETATVRSNVAAFAAERFAVWRCGGCRSIHARDEVDLDHYYRDYPFARAQPTRVLRYFHRRLWRRARAGGAPAAGRVLDYGCGSGLLVDDLRAAGVDAHGYDRYQPRFADPAVLTARYDCVIAQDVIEHVADPLALLDELGRLARPGGTIAIGTPDAAAIELAAPERHLHALHQPYHRHLLSTAALHAAAAARGWTLVRRWRRPYTDTPIPTLNARYLLRYLAANGDHLDAAFAPPRFRWAMLSPAALFDAAFGALRGGATDGTSVFRTPAAALPVP